MIVRSPARIVGLARSVATPPRFATGNPVSENLPGPLSAIEAVQGTRCFRAVIQSRDQATLAADIHDAGGREATGLAHLTTRSRRFARPLTTTESPMQTAITATDTSGGRTNQLDTRSLPPANTRTAAMASS